MAELKYQADFNDQFSGSFEALPSGEYMVAIVDSDVVVPKSGNGLMVKFTYEVVGDQEFNGRKIFDNVVIQHANDTAEKIGKQRLNTIAAICNLKNIRDTAELHGKVMVIVLGTKDSKDYGMQNFIKKYLPRGGGEPIQENETPQLKNPSFIKK
jgi:hypothetical protein